MMYNLLAWLPLVAAAAAYDFNFLLSGFNGASLVRSSGGSAICAAGHISVFITATNTKFKLEAPANNTIATEDLLEILQADSTIYDRVNGGNRTVSGNFSIASRLCYPAGANPSTVKTVQVLTHGFTLDKGYWDVSGLSYVDAAAKAGFATLAYDRLGVGQSARPDPIKVVQLPAEVEIVHGMAQYLRTGAVGGRKFKNVVATGHSLGSFIHISALQKRPQDFDANVITGLSANNSYNSPSIAIQDLANANTVDARFAGLPNGYLAQPVPQGPRFTFFRWPYYSESTFNALYAARQTGTLGELLAFNAPGLVLPNPRFTGPVDVVDGRLDFAACGGNCDYPVDLAAALIPALYPRAANGSQSYLVPESGHNINAHYTAPKAYVQINAFLTANGF